MRNTRHWGAGAENAIHLLLVPSLLKRCLVHRLLGIVAKELGYREFFSLEDFVVVFELWDPWFICRSQYGFVLCGTSLEVQRLLRVSQ
jgi:hypothetical protein